jgi:nucleotide-binding universal stress UspA family protein
VARYLLVANETAESQEMLRAVAEINDADPNAEFVIVIPATPLNLLQQFEGTAKSARWLAAQRAQSTRRHLESLGIRVQSTRIGSWDPYTAIEEELVNEKYEAIVLSTLPPGVSRWLRMDLPTRVARHHPEITLMHVVSRSATSRSTSESPS